MSVLAQRAQGTPEDEMTLAEIVEEMKRIREAMARDQRRIDQLKAETNAIKLEGQRKMAEIRSGVKRIIAMVEPC